MQERRIFRRFETDYPAVLRGGGAVTTSRVSNISRGGAQVVVDGSFKGKVGCSVEIIMDVGTTPRDVSMMGRVVYCIKQGSVLGVSFCGERGRFAFISSFVEELERSR